jgi:thiol-disulfide isomerase/thioredoxin
VKTGTRTIRRERGARMLGAIVLALVAPLTLAGGEPQGSLPVTLEDPVDGARVEVGSGAQALHVVFLATWCQPCVDELPQLVDLEARWGKRGYRLVLVAVPTRQTRDRLKKFSQEHRLPGRLLFDASGAAQRGLSVDMLPTHVVFDAGGHVVIRARSLAEGVPEAIEGLLGRGGGKKGSR